MGLQALKRDLLRPRKMRKAPTIPSSRQNVSTLKQMTLCTSSTCLCANLFSQSLDDDYIFPQFFFFFKYWHQRKVWEASKGEGKV